MVPFDAQQSCQREPMIRSSSCLAKFFLEKTQIRFKLRNDESGAVVVEQAVVLLTYFLFIILAIDTLRLSFFALTVPFIAATSAREITVGDPTTRNALDPTDAINRVIERAAGFGVSLADTNIGICPTVNTSCSGRDTGIPGDIITLQVRFPVRMLFGIIPINIEGIAVSRNEPFPTT